MAVHFGEQLIGQLLLLQQVAEAEDRGLMRDLVLTKLDACELMRVLTKQLRSLSSFFCAVNAVSEIAPVSITVNMNAAMNIPA
jgi:hypothetical protein